jgi:regulator of protease activity HflC (stomatin/prohibitin superfamily)
MDLTVYVCIAAVIVIIVISGLKIEQEYRRSVVFVLGRFAGIRGPGLLYRWDGDGYGTGQMALRS